MTRKLLWPVLGIGIFLIVLPFAISLPSKTSHAQTLVDDFHPLMQPAHVAKTVGYYNGTFVPLRPVAAEAVQAGVEVPKLIPALAKQLNMSPAQVQQFLAADFPATAKLLGSLPQLRPVFANVPGGLQFYRPLVRTMQSNVSNFQNVDSLPNLRLFTWFLVIPGVLLVLIGGYGLVAGGAPRLAPSPRPTFKAALARGRDRCLTLLGPAASRSARSGRATGFRTSPSGSRPRTRSA
jgi:hypothetical protein